MIWFELACPASEAFRRLLDSFVCALLAGWIAWTRAPTLSLQWYHDPSARSRSRHLVVSAMQLCAVPPMLLCLFCGEPKHPFGLLCVVQCSTSDGQTLFAGCLDGSIRVFDTRADKRCASFLFSLPCTIQSPLVVALRLTAVLNLLAFVIADRVRCVQSCHGVDQALEANRQGGQHLSCISASLLPSTLSRRCLAACCRACPPGYQLG